jgi:hypothetical protein
VSSPLPYCVRLTREVLARQDAFRAALRRVADAARADPAVTHHTYAFKADEARFARALLERHPERWLYRANQRAFCGDFVVVDMSSARAPQRRAWVVELKLGAPLREGGGAVGVQLLHAAEALAAVGASGVVTVLTGDARAVLDHLGRR